MNHHFCIPASADVIALDIEGIHVIDSCMTCTSQAQLSVGWLGFNPCRCMAGHMISSHVMRGHDFHEIVCARFLCFLLARLNSSRLARPSTAQLLVGWLGFESCRCMAGLHMNLSHVIRGHGLPCEASWMLMLRGIRFLQD